MYQLRMRFDGRFADPFLGRDSPEPYLPAVSSNGWGRFFVRYAATTSMITRHSGASRDVSLFFAKMRCDESPIIARYRTGKSK
jgi:hypothetical protein